MDDDDDLIIPEMQPNGTKRGHDEDSEQPAAKKAKVIEEATPNTAVPLHAPEPAQPVAIANGAIALDDD